ncbi:MAG TPA: 5'/3'-nucleotidase SurE [Bacteroidia bacterium]|jgi:5'-nucleotidase|nr:5'/3'-nucleotidase SurE [Bacteroidia bacterium]
MSQTSSHKRPLILITNDDGITAPGITMLSAIMKELGDVVVIAPDKPQSGMGHAITINSTLRIQKTNFHNALEEYSCSGTPVDCVKMAVNKILKRKPDLCVSGINHGSNYSINVLYSGTMSAAVEGALESIPSIGFSLCNHDLNANFEPAREYIKNIAQKILKEGLPEGVCLNVNIPDVPREEIKGVKLCRQAKANWIEELDERTDPSGKPYYWLTGKFDNFEKGEPDTDVWALESNFISIVPVQFDMTAYKVMKQLKMLEV